MKDKYNCMRLARIKDEFQRVIDRANRMGINTDELDAVFQREKERWNRETGSSMTWIDEMIKHFELKMSKENNKDDEE
jgi:hypothetical protein